jgi:hypothetical protein
MEDQRVELVLSSSRCDEPRRGRLRHGRQREPDLMGFVTDLIEGGPGCRVASPSARNDVLAD